MASWRISAFASSVTGGHLNIKLRVLKSSLRINETHELLNNNFACSRLKKKKKVCASLLPVIPVESITIGTRNVSFEWIPPLHIVHQIVCDLGISTLFSPQFDDETHMSFPDFQCLQYF